ncbi:hypothetical protein [Actinoplanes solisilvae]|uniref:hypothetical protein n=1 Tax=Actinoplanes solisilvae TaxID=2486853 RepID=UPI000FD81BB0|nr:hypothetical protein [Actinoplanes solisilvae]
MTDSRPNTNPAPATTEGTVPAFRFHYYLAITEFSGSSIRTAEMELHRSRPIQTMDDVASVKQWLRKEHGFVNAQVSFSLLRTDPARPSGRS